mmetsp:Transcript_132394/g.411582  ORF Transcript_132394/g.411582 Transcript_132394/m.411582 type:complete len:255 (+) Transcript_132394:396-1160(+)
MASWRKSLALGSSLWSTTTARRRAGAASRRRPTGCGSPTTTPRRAGSRRSRAWRGDTAATRTSSLWSCVTRSATRRAFKQSGAAATPLAGKPSPTGPRQLSSPGTPCSRRTPRSSCWSRASASGRTCAAPRRGHCSSRCPGVSCGPPTAIIGSSGGTRATSGTSATAWVSSPWAWRCSARCRRSASPCGRGAPVGTGPLLALASRPRAASLASWARSSSCTPRSRSRRRPRARTRRSATRGRSWFGEASCWPAD